MEQTDSRKGHYHSVFVTGLDNQIVTNRSAWLRNVFYAALLCALNIVAEGKERVGTEGLSLIHI